MSFSILIDHIPNPIILNGCENNERIYNTICNAALPEIPLPDPIHMHLFCGKMIWKTYTIYLESADNTISKHFDNSSEHAVLEITYQAKRGYNAALHGLTRTVFIIEIRIILSFGWCFNSSLLNAIHKNKDKIVLLIEWTGNWLFAWRPQYIYTDYTIGYRSFIWRKNEENVALSMDDEAERISDLRQITYARDPLLSPRADKRTYIGDHDAIHNTMSVLPLELGTKRYVRIRFYNMRNVGNVQVVMSPRQPFALRRRRRSLCVATANDSSEDSETPPSDGTWWVKIQVHPHLSASVRFAQPNTVCEVRLEAYEYTHTLGNLMMEPKSV